VDHPTAIGVKGAARAELPLLERGRMKFTIDPVDAAPAVCYEIRMLRWAYEAVSMRDSDDELERSCWLECCLLHCRNLIEFLDHKSKADRIRAVDFGLQWKGREDYTELLDLINVHLTHIGKDRIEKHGWRPYHVVEPILSDLRWFVSSLDESLRPLFADVEPLLEAHFTYVEAGGAVMNVTTTSASVVHDPRS